MKTVEYDPRSPYNKTNQINKYVSYLDFWTPVAIPATSSDILMTLDVKYKHRPDLLSYDLYGTPQLWWVFASRNPDVIKDPVFDFEPGITIYAPSSNNVGNFV